MKSMGLYSPIRGRPRPGVPHHGEIKCIKCGDLIPWWGAKPSEQFVATYTCGEHEPSEKSTTTYH